MHAIHRLGLRDQPPGTARHLSLAVTGSAVVLFAIASVASAATVNVNTTTDVVAVDGLCSLREAITSVNKQAASGNLNGECAAGDGNNDTIIVPSGSYRLALAGIDEDNNATGDLDILANVVLQGAGIGATIIDAGGIDRVIDIPASALTVHLIGLSLINGHAPDSVTTAGESGGAINNRNGASLFLTNVELSLNRSGNGASGSSSAFSAGSGGAIFSNGGTLMLSGCSIHDNSSGTGGGVSGTIGFSASGGNGGALASFGSSVGIELTSFDRNQTGSGGSGGMLGVASAGFGGGVYANGGSVTLLQSTFDSNRTSAQADGGSGAGGGLFVYNATTRISQTSITRNLAFDGGGLDSGDSPLTLNNVTLSGNFAGQFGGGLFVFGGAGQLDFVTLSANEASGDSGGARIENGNSGGATVSLRNSIVSGNSAPSLADCNVFGGTSTLASQGYNLAGSDCPANALGDVATTNPQLGPLADNGGIGLTQMPAPGGPAVDGGNCLASDTGADERGHRRFVDVPRAPNAADACDIGATELDDDIFWNGFGA
jgi:CSLREA domain-containing protein